MNWFGKKSFLTHFFPTEVNKKSIKFTSTFYFGIIEVILFLIVIISGFVLMFYYIPAPQEAFQTVVALTGGGIPLGDFWRDLHRFSADCLIIVGLLHLIRTFLMGTYFKPKRIIWLTGIVAFILIMAITFTGYILPANRDGYWAATVGGELIGSIPFIGNYIKEAFWGGSQVTVSIILRSYALHIIISIVLMCMIIWHLWRLRIAGGLTRPLNSDKTKISFYPDFYYRIIIVTLITTFILSLSTIFFDSPIGSPAFPVQSEDPTKAPWFFLWIQEIVSYDMTFGSMLVLLLISIITFLPFWDHNYQDRGKFIPASRFKIVIVFIITLLLIIVFSILGWLRGPGWTLW